MLLAEYEPNLKKTVVNIKEVFYLSFCESFITCFGG